MIGNCYCKIAYLLQQEEEDDRSDAAQVRDVRKSFEDHYFMGLHGDDFVSNENLSMMDVQSHYLQGNLSAKQKNEANGLVMPH